MEEPRVRPRQRARRLLRGRQQAQRTRRSHREGARLYGHCDWSCPMRLSDLIHRGFVSASVALFLLGCQTQPAVYELAEKTSMNTGVFQHHLGDLAAGSKALAAERADLIVSMESFNARLDGFIKRELYMRQQSNKPADWAKIDALMKKLTALRDEIIRIEQAARIADRAGGRKFSP